MDGHVSPRQGGFLIINLLRNASIGDPLGMMFIQSAHCVRLMHEPEAAQSTCQTSNEKRSSEKLPQTSPLRNSFKIIFLPQCIIDKRVGIHDFLRRQ